jgi:hypothetical protein
MRYRRRRSYGRRRLRRRRRRRRIGNWAGRYRRRAGRRM